MQARSDWSKWAESLRRLKLDGFAAWLLEAGGPLTILGAQAVYMSQPFIGGKNLDSLAHMLEEDDQTQAFARYLRGGNPPDGTWFTGFGSYSFAGAHALASQVAWHFASH